MKIITVLGARPQFVKAGIVTREIIKHKNINEVIIHTGQHYDVNMSDVFFDEMQIPKPNYFLGIGGNSHGEMTGQMIQEIEKIVLKEKPDWMLVYGDTNSTLAGAIVASKLHLKLAHIEAGLRSYNMKMPEEVNRILTDRVSNALFCPTKLAVENLKNEGFSNQQSLIINSGDVMLEAALFYKKHAVQPKMINDSTNFILATVHRAENTNDLNRLKNIIEALNEINIHKKIILPIHPRTKKILNNNNIKTKFMVIPPVSYFEMLWLIERCDMIMTDSGGLQKEAYFFKKNSITLRDETEWKELVDNKFNVLPGANKTKIINAYFGFKFNKNFTTGLYGKGNSSQIVINKLISY
jgi:UDP-GlcNAc3NAcA epimerase